MTNPHQTTHLSVSDLAKRWQRTPEWIRAQAKRGDIPAFKLGAYWRFRLDQIEAFELQKSNPDPFSTTITAAKRRGWR